MSGLYIGVIHNSTLSNSTPIVFKSLEIVDLAGEDSYLHMYSKY